MPDELLTAAGGSLDAPFLPRGTCYLWEPALVGLHAGADVLIAAAYYLMPVLLIYLARKREDLPFHGIFVMFGAFIVACGTTHLVSVWTLWVPAYWLAGGVKVATAAISWATAVILVPLVPKALALASPAQLARANAELSAEIAQRQRAEAALKTALEQKEVLLRELHHRVKNHLQLVSSLLNLQARYLIDPATRRIFDETRGRVRSMALMNSLLDDSGALASLDFGRYLRQLAAQLSDSYGVSPQTIAVTIHVPSEIRLPTAVGVPCGLIVHELLANAFKHAFPAGLGGAVIVAMRREADAYELLVADSGVGLAPEIEPATSRSLGFRLVVALATQLGGTLVVERERGTRLRLTFAVATT
jgi:two-component sensor histidine kinase